jgi:hypothetical protein
MKRQRDYYESHPEKKQEMLERVRLYEQENKERIKERNSVRVTCECGEEILKVVLKNHLTTDLHKKKMGIAVPFKLHHYTIQHMEKNLDTYSRFVEQHDRQPTNRECRFIVQWRNDFKQNPRPERLTDEYVSLIESLPYWTWNVHDSKFYRNISKIQSFKNEQNRLPKRHSGDDEEERLARFMQNCRKHMKDGQPSMTQDIVDACISLGIITNGLKII